MASFGTGIPGIGSIIGGLAGLFGGLGTSTVNQNGTTSGTTNQSGSSTGTNTPNLSSLQSLLSNIFGSGLINQYETNTNLTPYTNQGLESINDTSNAASQNISNTLAARGQGFSPAASTALTQQELARSGQQGQFLSQIPLLQKSLQQSNLSQLLQGFGALPTGSTSTGSSNLTGSTTGTTQSTTTKPGSILGGLTGLFTGGLAGLFGGGSKNAN